MPLAMAQDTAAPLGAFLVDMVSAIFLALTAIKPLLALSLPMVKRVLVVLLLGYATDGGVVNEGGTDSMMITVTETWRYPDCLLTLPMTAD
jgi:hypothetical protein